MRFTEEQLIKAEELALEWIAKEGSQMVEREISEYAEDTGIEFYFGDGVILVEDASFYFDFKY